MSENLMLELTAFEKWKNDQKNIKTSEKSKVFKNLELIAKLLDDGYSKKLIFRYLRLEKKINCSYDFFRICINEFVFGKEPKKSERKPKKQETEIKYEFVFFDSEKIKKKLTLFFAEKERVTTEDLVIELKKEWLKENPNCANIRLLPMNFQKTLLDFFNSYFKEGFELDVFLQMFETF